MTVAIAGAAASGAGDCVTRACVGAVGTEMQRQSEQDVLAGARRSQQQAVRSTGFLLEQQACVFSFGEQQLTVFVGVPSAALAEQDSPQAQARTVPAGNTLHPIATVRAIRRTAKLATNRGIRCLQPSLSPSVRPEAREKVVAGRGMGASSKEQSSKFQASVVIPHSGFVIGFAVVQGHGWRYPTLPSPSPASFPPRQTGEPRFGLTIAI